MDEYVQDQVLQWYERIEEQMLEFSKHVPMTEDSKAIPVPTSISWIMDACGLLDSVFRDLTPESVAVRGESKARKDCTIQDFAELYAYLFDLPRTRSLLLVSPLRYVMPFQGWKDRNESGAFSSLSWWKTYTNLKHDRLAYIREGTLGVAINSLAALHQVLSRAISPEKLRMLIRRGWFSPKPYRPEDLLHRLATKGTLQERFIVQTRLFATPVGEWHSATSPEENHFPPDLSDLQPWKFHARTDFYNFLGHYDKRGKEI